MKRLASAAIIVVFVVALGISAIPFLISADGLKRGISDAIAAGTGLEVEITGEATKSLYPAVTATARGLIVKVPGVDEPLMVADTVTAGVRLWPLLFGRTEFDDLHLRRPRVVAGPDDELTDQLLELLSSIGSFDIDSLSFEAGSISTGGTRIRDLVGAISWPSFSTGFEFSGSMRLLREVIDFEGELQDPGQLVESTGSEMRLQLSSRLLDLGFEGRMTLEPELQIKGKTELEISEPAAAARWAGAPELSLVAGAQFALKGDLNWIASLLSMEQATVHVGENSAEGALALDLAGVPHLRGTLAFGELKFAAADGATGGPTPTDYQRAVSAFLGGWRNDLRISASAVRLGELETGPIAGTLVTGDGLLTASIGDLEIMGGHVQGAIALADVQDAVELRADLALDGIDAGAIAEAFSAPRILEGDISGRATMETQGTMDASLFADATGSLEMLSSGGSLNGFDLGQLIDAERPPGKSGITSGSATRYEELSAAIEVVPGGITVHDLVVRDENASLTGSVRIDAPSGALSGSAAVMGEEMTRTFSLAGTWVAPEFSVSGPENTVAPESPSR